jgi:hypothetical protein
MSALPAGKKLLTALLVLLALCAALAGIVYILIFHRLLFLMPHWAAYTFVGIPLLRLVAIWCIWQSSRLGVLLYVAVTLADIAICSIARHEIGPSIFGIIGSTLLVVFVLRGWPLMRWLPANYSLKRTAAERSR